MQLLQMGLHTGMTSSLSHKGLRVLNCTFLLTHSGQWQTRTHILSTSSPKARFKQRKDPSDANMASTLQHECFNVRFLSFYSSFFK